jgi:nitrate/nitrite-specific signal transduction histidine kinase
LRFHLAKPAKFNPGEEVEVVGLVDLEGVSPALRQAIARKTDYSSLPIPRKLSLNSLNNSYDSTLGCGFNPAFIKGNGLVNLHERMKKLAGSCLIESTPGEGTNVTLRLVLPKRGH